MPGPVFVVFRIPVMEKRFGIHYGCEGRDTGQPGQAGGKAPRVLHDPETQPVAQAGTVHILQAVFPAVDRFIDRIQVRLHGFRQLHPGEVLICDRMPCAPETVPPHYACVQRMLQAHVAARKNMFVRGDADNVGVGGAVQRVMAAETGQVGEHLRPAGGASGPAEQGRQEQAGFCGVHTAAAAFMMPERFVKKPDIRPEERKRIRFGHNGVPNLFRQGGKDFPAEGYVDDRIRHAISSVFRALSGSVYQFLNGPAREFARTALYDI